MNKKDYVKNFVTGEEGNPRLPESNVLYYITDCGDTVVIRPSGTEPKIKFYFSVKAQDRALAEARINRIRAALEKNT